MADKANAIKMLPGNIVRSVKEIKSELKKVIWPTPKQLVKNTVAVIVCVLIVGGLLWCFDLILSAIFAFVTGQ